MELFKNKAKILYKEGIKTLISNFDDDIEKEILSSFNNEKLKLLKEKTINELIDFISYMNENWFDLLEYHSSKISKKWEMINEKTENYLSLICVINFMKEISIKSFKKYVVKVLKNESTIFSNI